MTNPHNPEELIAIVNDDDVVVGKGSRKHIHSSGKLHRETSVLIVNLKNEILVQERMDNGKLDYSASGHFPYDENYLDAAVREVREELGLKIDKSKFIKISKHRIDYSGKSINNRFITLWEVKGSFMIEDMRIDSSEVKSLKYYSIPELKKIIDKTPEKMSAGFIESLQIYFQKKRL